MRVLGLTLYKITEFIMNVYHAFNLKNIETSLMVGYIKWSPLLIRLFQ